MNICPLTYFHHRRYTYADVDSVCREIDSDFMAMRLTFDGQGAMQATVTSKLWDRQQGHYPTIIDYFTEMLEEQKLQDLKGSVIVWLEDGMWEPLNHLSRTAPILSFGRKYNDHCTFLIPDPAFLGSFGYRDEIREMIEIEEAMTWERKQPTVFWRGASTGCGIEGPDWKETPRIRLALLSRDMKDCRRLDACISKVDNFDDPAQKNRIIDEGIVASYKKFSEFLSYRYLIDVDGYCVAWRSLFLKLCSRSVVLKVGSDYEQWYFNRIKPWKHYVPVKNDLSDLNFIIDWLHAHDSQCRQIMECANQSMAHVTYADSKKESATLLRNLLSYQHGEPAERPKSVTEIPWPKPPA